MMPQWWKNWRKPEKASIPPENAAALIIEFAKSKGFEFNAEDLTSFEENIQKELSLEELEQINAGVWGVCIILGIGFGTADGERGGKTMCLLLGIGMGTTDREYTPKSERD